MKKLREEIDDELREFAPRLSQMERGSAFKVPDGYFEGLADQVLQKSKAEAHQPLKKQTEPGPSWFDIFAQQIAMLFQPRRALALASFVLVIVVAIWVWPEQVVEQSGIANAAAPQDLSAEELDQYIAAHLDDFDTELLYVMSQPVGDDNINTAIENLEVDERMIEDLLEDFDASDLNDLL